MRACLLTPWTGKGSGDDPYRPLAAEIFQFKAWRDVTVQPGKEIPPQPNLLLIEAILDPGALSALQADARFKLLWVDPLNMHGVPGASEYNALKEYLVAQAFTAPQVSAFLGATVNQRTRRLLSETLKAHLATLKKKPA